MSKCFNFLRIYLMVGCLFDIALAVGCFIAGAFLSSLDDDLIPVDGAASVKKYVAIAFYVLGGICVACGVMGIFAFWKKWKCFQTLFILVNLFFLIIFAVLLAAMIFAQTYINKFKDDTCTSISYLQDATSTFSTLKSFWCTTSSVGSGCECLIPVANLSKWTAAQQLQITSSPVTGISTIDKCTQSSIATTMSSNKLAVQLLTAVEKQWSCSGICEGQFLYFFNDVSQGPPEHLDGCFNQLKDLLVALSTGVLIFDIIATIFTFLNVSIGFINCCCAPKERKETNDQQKDQELTMNKQNMLNNSKTPFNNVGPQQWDNNQYNQNIPKQQNHMY